MGLQLPGELTSLLDILGYTWPQADETRLFELGQAWIGFAGTIDSVVARGRLRCCHGLDRQRGQ